MNGNKLVLGGVGELMAELQKLPPHLRDRGGAIAVRHGEAAAEEIRAAYPIGPTYKSHTGGALRRGVKVLTQVTAHGAYVVVRSMAAIAFIFEHGTQARHTDLGYDRGSMPAPPAKIFVPTVQRHRRAMEAEFEGLLVEAGFEVSRVA